MEEGVGGLRISNGVNENGSSEERPSYMPNYWQGFSHGTQIGNPKWLKDDGTSRLEDTEMLTPGALFVHDMIRNPTSVGYTGINSYVFKDPKDNAEVLVIMPQDTDEAWEKHAAEHGEEQASKLRQQRQSILQLNYVSQLYFPDQTRLIKITETILPVEIMSHGTKTTKSAKRLVFVPFAFIGMYQKATNQKSE